MNQIMEPLVKRSKFGRERMSCIGCRNFQLKVQRLNESQKANEYVKEQLRSQLNEMLEYKTNYNMLADQYQIVSTQNQELKRCETQWQQNFRLGYDEFVLLRERNSSLEQENMKLKAMVKKGCEKYGELHNSSQIANERIVSLEDQLRAAQEQISDLQKDCQEKDKLLSRSHEADLKVHSYCVDLEHQKAELLEQIEEMNRDTKVLHSKYNYLYKEKVRLDELITSLKLKNKKQKREFKEWRSVYGKEMSRQMASMEAELVGVTKENDVLREAVHCLTATGEAQAKDAMIKELLAEEMAPTVARTQMEEVLNLRCQQLEQKNFK